MKIHENKELFKNALETFSIDTEMDIEMVEKDYYLSLILQGISNKLDFLVFKGGTSLSKCHKIIDRFSEDIDITVNTHITQSQRKKVKQVIKEVCDELGLEIVNYDEIQSRHVFNRYKIKYSSCLDYTVFGSFKSVIEPFVLLETTYTTISFPTEIMHINSFLGEYIKEKNTDVYNIYNLKGFSMNVQTIERTLADKVFAICDYYLQEKVDKHSRHLYDIYKLIQKIPLDDSFSQLVEEIRIIRKESIVCPSAADDIDIPELLQEIIDKNIYHKDYTEVTYKLLGEKVSYEEVIKSIQKIIKSNCFEKGVIRE